METDVQRPQLESFFVVLGKCRTWLRQLPTNFRVLSLQTLHYRQQAMKPIDTMRTTFWETNMYTYQIKFLRVFLSMVKTTSPEPPRVLPLLNLRCRMFVPEVTVHHGCFSKPVYEGTAVIRQWDIFRNS